MLDVADREPREDHPRAGRVARGVPRERGEVDAAGGETVGHEVAERRRADVPADARAACLLRDVLALGEDRTLVPADALDGQAGGVRDLLRRRARADARLDLPRAQRPGALRAQLLELRAVAAHGRAQRFVDAHTEARPVRGHQDEMLPVLVQTHQLQLTHATSR